MTKILENVNLGKFSEENKYVQHSALLCSHAEKHLLIQTFNTNPNVISFPEMAGDILCVIW